MHKLEIKMTYTKDGSNKKGVTTQTYEFEEYSHLQVTQKAVIDALFALGAAGNAKPSSPGKAR